MPKPPKVTVEVRQKQGSWVATATFVGLPDEPRGWGSTAEQALRELAEDIGHHLIDCLIERLPDPPIGFTFEIVSKPLEDGEVR